jgi:glycerate kinase
MRFLDQNQNLITDLPAYLLSLKSIELDQLDQRIFRIKLVILCDVDNTMLGNEGAARVFGPQKGASEQAVTLLEERLCHWNRIVLEKTGKDLSTLIHGGAAGGMAASMQALLGAELKAGIDYFLDNCGFDELLQESDLLITGEGSIDSQSIKGKAPVGAARRAKRKGIPVIALAGSIPPEPDGELQEIFDALFSINPGIISIQEALAGTAANLKRTACNLGDLLAMGKAFGSLSAK